jgi:hypothetical protein
MDVGGFQTLEADDVAVANLAPELGRRGAAQDVLEALGACPDGLTTQEVAATMTSGPVSMLQATDRDKIERALVDAVYAGQATRVPLGDDALWMPVAA